MKRMAMIFIGLMLVASFASASSFTTQGTPGNSVSFDLDSRAAVSITQNADPGTIVDGASVACTAGGIASDNWFARRFVLADHGLLALNVQDVDWAVEALNTNGVGTTYTIDVVLYTIPTGAGMFFGNTTEIARVSALIDDLDDMMFKNTAISGYVDGSTDDLIVALDCPIDNGDLVGFWPGCSAPATPSSWLASEGCAISEPIEVGGIGFPDAQLILVVNGDDGTTATEATAFSSVKSLY